MPLVNEELTLSEARALAVRDPEALFSNIVQRFNGRKDLWHYYEVYDSKGNLTNLIPNVFMWHGTEVYTISGRVLRSEKHDFITLVVPQEVRRLIMGSEASSIDDVIEKPPTPTGSKTSVGYIFPNPDRFELMQAYVGLPQAAIYESPALVLVTPPGHKLSDLSSSKLSLVEVHPRDLAREASRVSSEVLSKDSRYIKKGSAVNQLLDVYVQEYYVPTLRTLQTLAKSWPLAPA